jgi:hypothetical protein
VSIPSNADQKRNHKQTRMKEKGLSGGKGVFNSAARL